MFYQTGHKTVWLVRKFKKTHSQGAFRESNSGPLAPKARIIPLDQMPFFLFIVFYNRIIASVLLIFLPCTLPFLVKSYQIKLFISSYHVTENYGKIFSTPSVNSAHITVNFPSKFSHIFPPLPKP